MKKILCVEDSTEEQRLLKDILHDHSVTFAENLAQGRRLLEAEPFQLLMVDISLPDGSGLDLVSKARSIDRFFNMPILILSGMTALNQKEAAFAFGADDYITKPYDPRELLMRVEAKIKRYEQSRRNRDLLPVGDLVLNRSSRTLHRGTETFDLTSIEYRIFDTMAGRQEEVFARDALIHAVWGPRTVITLRTVDTHIANLRRKIQSSQVSIQTAFGSGYKLVIGSPQDSTSVATGRNCVAPSEPLRK